MAKEGAPHSIMREAFEKRLKQLYSEPEHYYSFGKKIPNGLKPDIYLLYPDGRQWVFEMVHGNRHYSHLMENHRRYQEAGIQDIWILWEDLRTRLGKPFSMQHGFFIGMVPSDRFVNERNLSSTHKAILEMQPPGNRYLYAFTVTPQTPGLKAELFNMLSIGIDKYTLKPSETDGYLLVTMSTIPMVDLSFDTNGHPQEHLHPAFENLDMGALLNVLGADSSQTMVPEAIIEQVINLSRSPDKLTQVITLFLSSYLENAPPEQIHELIVFCNSREGQSVEPFESSLGTEVIQEIFNDPSAIQALAEEGEAACIYVREKPIPKVIKQLITDLLKLPIKDSAEFMNWQETSSNLKKARAAVKKRKK